MHSSHHKAVTLLELAQYQEEDPGIGQQGIYFQGKRQAQLSKSPWKPPEFKLKRQEGSRSIDLDLFQLCKEGPQD